MNPIGQKLRVWGLKQQIRAFDKLGGVLARKTLVDAVNAGMAKLIRTMRGSIRL